MTRRFSIRLRIAVWYLAVLAVTLAAFSGAVFYFLRHDLNANLDSSLRSRAAILLDIISLSGGQPSLQQLLPADSGSANGGYLRTFDSTGAVILDSSSSFGKVPMNADAVQSALSGKATFRSTDGPSTRIYTLPIRQDGSITGALEVGQSRDDVTDTLNTLGYIIAIAYPLTLIVASFGGLFLAARALSPIDRITRQAQRISAENLDERIALDLPNDELGRLARTFDAMIARLDDAFERQRQFTADASHELRTPLTILKGQLDVALNRERDADAYRKVLQAANNEVDHMIRLTSGLLTLARADANEVPIRKEPVDVGSIVAGAVEQVRPTSEARGVSLALQAGPDVTLDADEDLLLQLMLNLLDNALKHTPSGGHIEAGWSVNGPRATLFVSDSGVGIAAEHLPHLFDRFYRVEKARSRADGGAGLGLAICRWIADVHGGTLAVESEPGAGSRFSFELPITQTDGSGA